MQKHCIVVISEDPSLNVEKESHEFRLILYHAYMYMHLRLKNHVHTCN